MPFFRHSGVELNYEAEGEGGAVVFLHGYTGSSRDWAFQQAALSNRYRVITMDHRGHGRTSAPSAEQDYSMELFVEDVRGLLAHLDVQKCCLVGHSLGGFIALEFALGHPELLAGLVLVDTSSGDWERPEGYAQMRAKLDELARSQGMEAAFEYDAANNPMRIERFRRHPDQREIARQRMLMTSADGYIFVAKAMARWRPVTGRLGEIKAPTLVFWGDEDLPFLESSRVLERGIPNARLVTVHGSGHSPQEESPEFFNATLMEFLETLSL